MDIEQPREEPKPLAEMVELGIEMDPQRANARVREEHR